MDLNLDLDLDLDEAIESAAEESDLNWDSGGSDAPLFGDERTKSLDDYKITSFIATKYNYLSPAHRRKEGEEIYKKLYEQAKNEGRKTYEVLKIDETGELVGTGTEEVLKSGFSLKALLALDADSYFAIKEGAYRITTPERDPEFLVVTNFGQLEKVKNDPTAGLDATGQYFEDYTEAVSSDKVVNIIRLRNLVQLAFETETDRIEIINFDHTQKDDMQKLGALIPSARFDSQSGQPKITYRARYFTTNNDKVTKIGDFLDLPRAFNRSYRGERPSDIKSIENEDFVLKTLPHIDIDQLTTLKTGENVPAGTTLRQQEEIPYEEQEETWKIMGVEPQMLDAIRASASSSRSLSNREIRNIYEEGRRAFKSFRKATL